ncbi:MAG: glutamine synthetase family protein, partial [Pseudomonadota bacterium]
MTSHSARIAAIDLNGQLRGKRVAADDISKDMQMPFSAINLDIFGCDINGSPLVYAMGDRDGWLVPVGRDPVPMPWLARETMLDLRMMTRDNRSPYTGDPRQALIAALAPFRARADRVVAAAELEFFLFPEQHHSADDILSIRALDRLELFFNAIDDGADAMGLPARVITSEAAPGQYEVTLTHGPALRLADDIILMKELIKGTARAHGLTATFHPKPNEGTSGTGLHIHCSILDKSGKNIFSDGTFRGTPELQHAIAGLLSKLEASTAILAPFPVSYDRFVGEAHAPTNASWGYDNRTVAVRVPAGRSSARRLEHRVAGGDANPYLLLAVILGAINEGLQRRETAPPPTTGNAYQASNAGITQNLHQALDA